jgi:hypothetical protein
VLDPAAEALRQLTAEVQGDETVQQPDEEQEDTYEIPKIIFSISVGLTL